MDIFSILFAYASMAFVAAGGLWYIKMGVLAVVLVAGLWLVWRLRARPGSAVSAGMVLTLMVVVIGSVQAPTRRDMYGDPRLEVSMAQRDKVIARCEAELNQLTRSYYAVDSIADTVTGLDTRSLLRLLLNRRLAFVEVKVQRLPGKPPFIVRSRSPMDPAWTVNQDAATYAHIDLAPRGAGTCVPDAELPVSARDELAATPLPAGQCLRIRPVAQATARHVLNYQNDPASLHGQLGFYQLIDTHSNQVLAQLPTYDKPQQVTSEFGVGTLSPHHQRAGCREPMMALMDRLVRAGTTSP